MIADEEEIDHPSAQTPPRLVISDTYYFYTTAKKKNIPKRD